MDCPSSIYDHTVNSKGAINFPVFHRNHPCISMMSTASDDHIEIESEIPIDAIQDRSINEYHFLMPIKLGTPSVTNLLAIDTGSSLSWVQCQPCKPECHKQATKAGQIFDPDKSITYQTARCKSGLCSIIKRDLKIQTANCMEKDDTCLYMVEYGLGDSYTVGKVAWDHLVIGTNDTSMELSFLFGCSLDVRYPEKEAGIIGFGTSRVSFFEQVAKLIDYKAFRYCFPRDETMNGYMILGDYPREGIDGYTPLFQSAFARTYSVKMEGLVANGQVIVATPSHIIVDSGSPMTLLKEGTFKRLDNVITEAMTSLNYERTDSKGPDHICFQSIADSLNWKGKHSVFSNWSSLPTVEMAFTGAAALSFPPKNTFYYDEKHGLCMTFIPERTRGIQVLGNAATRSFETIFDIQGKIFGIRYSAC